MSTTRKVTDPITRVLVVQRKTALYAEPIITAIVSMPDVIPKESEWTEKTAAKIADDFEARFVEFRGRTIWSFQVFDLKNFPLD